MQASKADAVTNFLCVGGTLFFTSWLASSSELPLEALQKLKSSEFHDREHAQTELLAWARTNTAPAMAELFTQSRNANDPEVRERCLAILHELVNDEYLKEGEGYIGVGLGRDEIVNVQGDPTPRHVIRVTQVQNGSPAEKADLRLNDLIVGLDRDVWHELDASELFRKKIRLMKPTTKAALKILRDGGLIAIEVDLGRRPLMADNPFFNGQNIDLEASERAAKEAYFRLWLSQRKMQK